MRVRGCDWWAGVGGGQEGVEEGAWAAGSCPADYDADDVDAEEPCCGWGCIPQHCHPGSQRAGL